MRSITGRDDIIIERKELTEKNQQIQEMKDLLRQVVAVMDSPEYESQVWMAWIHGHRYDGPKINMKRIRELLELPPKEGDWDK